MAEHPHSVIFVCALGNGPSEWDIPQERLPRTYPKARTFYYAYSGAQSDLASTVNGAALDLLSEWDKLESEWSTNFATAHQRSNGISGSFRPSRPVIFVCHSLGGFVVKQVPSW